MDEQEWERLLGIKTAGRDDSQSDSEHHPYEPTDYCVLQRVAQAGYIGKRNLLLDYGSGKGRVSFFLAYETRCQAIGIEYDQRLWEKAMENKGSATSGGRVSFVLSDAETYDVPDKADRCFFFNPFSLHTLKRVLAQIFDSLYRSPRDMQLFFYYPNEETEAFLLNHVNLDVDAVVDCRDLFPEEDGREKVLVLTPRYYA